MTSVENPEIGKRGALKAADGSLRTFVVVGQGPYTKSDFMSVVKYRPLHVQFEDDETKRELTHEESMMHIIWEKINVQEEEQVG
jgi:hypothetical protein